MKKNAKTKKPLFYRFIKSTVGTFYKKPKIIGLENIPDQPSIIVGNHAQLYGPIFCEMYFPKNKSIWTMGQMLNKKEVPAYAFEDFWSGKPRWTHWFYKILSHMIAPIAAYIFNNADTIAVYKDTRIITTFKQSIKKLNFGNNIVLLKWKNKENKFANTYKQK